MQQPPTATDLLATVAEVLEREVVPALHGPVQHHARVAASLVGIVERELRLGPEAAERERDAIDRLLGADDDASLAERRADLARRLRAGFADEAPTDTTVWQALMEAVRADLSIAKPGHDAWEGD
jgi:hypothetical protein